MIVLDGSSSMWGQINGRAKLEIARETLRTVLQGVPDSTELGLIAYGHREKGNCEDIEMIVPPAPATAAQIADEVDKLKFLGKTPLSAAVQIAAQNLRFTEDRATVVLITDGIETCGVNVCEMGNQLESQGVDFKVHVVGFGLSKEQGEEVACLAENTGGHYFSANDADGLVVALNETVAVVVPPEVTFIARDQDENIIDNIALDWLVNDADSAKVFETKSKTKSASALQPGDYTIMVSGVDVSGGREFTIEEGVEDQTIYVPVELVVQTATLDAPAEVTVTSEFEVIWTGSDENGDYITIVEAGASEGSYRDYFNTAKGSPSTLTAPDALGEFEIRYVSGPSKRTIASRKITVASASATLKAPGEIAAGAEFEVEWTGPDNRNDYITIVEAGAKEGKYGDYSYTNRGTPVKISAPDGLGAYEIRYMLGQSKRTLASTKITLTANSATMNVENTPVPGGNLVVSWTGPGYQSDYITIVEVGTPEGKFGKYVSLSRGSPVTLETPRALGKFELRYITGKSKRTLLAVPVTLSPVTATISAPASVKPGSVVEVTWTGPENRDDFIEIVTADAAENTKPLGEARTAQGSPLSIYAPGSAGDYVVQYRMRDTGEILTSAPLKVE